MSCLCYNDNRPVHGVYDCRVVIDDTLIDIAHGLMSQGEWRDGIFFTGEWILMNSYEKYGHLRICKVKEFSASLLVSRENQC